MTARNNINQIDNLNYQETLHKHKNTEGEIEMIDNSRSTLEEDSHKQNSLYKNWPLISSIIAYCVFTLHDTAYSEVMILTVSLFIRICRLVNI